MSNAMDLLLKLDKTKLVRPTVDVEIKRLSEALGETFTVTVQSITGDEFSEIQESLTANTDGEINIEKNIQAKYVVKGVRDPDFSSMKVIEKFDAINATEAVVNCFLPGEITGLFNIINKLSGFNKDAVKELKKTSTKIQK